MATESAKHAWMRQEGPGLLRLLIPGQVALIAGVREDSLNLLNGIGVALNLEPRSVSLAGLTPTPVQTVNELLKRIETDALLYDLEGLCWEPWLRADVSRFLRIHARNKGVIAVWPGTINESQASYSAPGRRDYVSFDAADFSLLRPVVTRFPDEAPYTLERIQ